MFEVRVFTRYPAGYPQQYQYFEEILGNWDLELPHVDFDDVKCFYTLIPPHYGSFEIRLYGSNQGVCGQMRIRWADGAYEDFGLVTPQWDALGFYKTGPMFASRNVDRMQLVIPYSSAINQFPDWCDQIITSPDCGPYKVRLLLDIPVVDSDDPEGGEKEYLLSGNCLQGETSFVKFEVQAACRA